MLSASSVEQLGAPAKKSADTVEPFTDRKNQRLAAVFPPTTNTPGPGNRQRERHAVAPLRTSAQVEHGC